MDDDITIRLNSGRLKFLLRILECALEYDELSADERDRAILWSDWLKYMEEYGQMCVKDR